MVHINLTDITTYYYFFSMDIPHLPHSLSVLIVVLSLALDKTLLDSTRGSKFITMIPKYMLWHFLFSGRRPYGEGHYVQWRAVSAPCAVRPSGN